MTTIYQITAECAYVTTDTATGRAKTLLYKGAFVPEGAPELKHLLDSGMVAKVGGDDETGINALGGLGVAESDQGAAGSVVSSTPDTGNTQPFFDPDAPAVREAEDAKVEKQRAAAREKLPADGSAPDGRAAEAVWVEYAVKQGFDYAEASKAGKAELQKLTAK